MRREESGESTLDRMCGDGGPVTLIEWGEVAGYAGYDGFWDGWRRDDSVVWSEGEPDRGGGNGVLPAITHHRRHYRKGPRK